MKVYIAGKITGKPDYKTAFAEAAARIAQRGDIPLNPATLPEGMAPAAYMEVCFSLIRIADMVVLLPDWMDSGGARLERSYCRYTGKPVRELAEYLEAQT